MSEESRRADNLAFEMKKLEEKHETAMKEKEVGVLLKCALKIWICVFSLAAVTFFTKHLDVCLTISFPTYTSNRGLSLREIL